MADRDRPLILVTNDDGFDSAGLRAAARAASRLGEVLVVAPAKQQTGAGRSMPDLGPLIPEARPLTLNGQPVRAYAMPGTPAQMVMYGVLALAERDVDLVISGVNYGENVGIEITASGTLGAALEAAAMGIPAMAVSRETHKRFHFRPDDAMDFSAAEHFTELFGRLLLREEMPDDVGVLKVDVPEAATRDTPWRVTRVSRQRYFHPMAPIRHEDGAVYIDYEARVCMDTLEKDSDVWAIAVDRVVSVSPISLDLTSRTDLQALQQRLTKRR